MGLSRTVSELDGDFGTNIAKFSNSLYFVPPLKGFPLQLGTGAVDQKKLE